MILRRGMRAAYRNVRAMKMCSTGGGSKKLTRQEECKFSKRTPWMLEGDASRSGSKALDKRNHQGERCSEDVRSETALRWKGASLKKVCLLERAQNELSICLVHENDDPTPFAGNFPLERASDELQQRWRIMLKP